MSAESHQKRASSTSEAVRMVPNIVPPQAVSDRSIIDSVAGFINDVALTNVPQTNPKDHILWVKFETLADISDTSLGEDWDVEGNLPPPLLLCIGYASGIQVWAIPANGEAIEVMSWKHGAVSVLRILPTPFLSNNSELANDLLDQFIHKRPLMALVGDCPTPNQPSSTQNQQMHAVNFVSLKDGDLIKTIRFKSPILDIVANRTSIAITFYERIAIFDARTLEDRLTVTTCYPCPNGLCPIALGDRWLAYAERKLIPSKTSAGGCFIDGVPSYTATVLNAAKSLGKGLRELGEQVAAGLVGNTGNVSGPSSLTSSVPSADGTQAGVVTILDIKHPIKDISPTSGTPVAVNGNDPIVAHFLAHTEAVYAMSFDPSGMLLVTADKRGHDFNVFRIQPHPCGSVLAAVHHLYVLHRGDTSAKVQDIAFSFDSRWIAVSTLRGTTHVFPITPYGGQCGFRTHSAPYVVNRLSRFHRSAGLAVDGRSSSPILMSEYAVQSTAYANPRLPPFPHPTVVLPLAQLRQPSSLNSTSSLMSQATSTQQGSKVHTRQRLHSSNEESYSKPLRVAAQFAKARSWLLDPPGVHDTPSKLHRAVDSLFIIAGHGALIQYDLEPRHVSNIPKEKICDETPIELEVEAKAQWILGQRSNSQLEISPPLPADNWLIKDRVIDNNLNLDTSQMDMIRTDERDDRWLSQVEIVTHAGPSRRLWMGPQFAFKLYHTPSGNSLHHIDTESIEVGASRVRSTPVNMPAITQTTSRPLVPVLIESGSCSSHEQSPRLLDSFHYESTDSDVVLSGPESQLKEDLADAMRDCAPIPVARESEESLEGPRQAISIDSLGSEGASSNSHTVVVSIVNPQGTITNILSSNPSNETSIEEKFSNESYILENCDETMFRPLIAVMNVDQHHFGDESMDIEDSKPVEVPLELVVPVIDGRVMEEKKRTRELEAKQLKKEAANKKKKEAEEKRRLEQEEEEKRRMEQEEKLRMEEEEEKRKLAEEEKRKAEEEQRKLEEEKIKADEERNKIENEKAALKKKTDEPAPSNRKNKKAQKYNKKSADSAKKLEPTPIVEIIQKAEEVQQEPIEEIEIREPVVSSLEDVMETVDLNIEEISMEVPVVEENLRLSVELPLVEKKIESMDLPSAVEEIVEQIVVETPLEEPAVVEEKPEIIVPQRELTKKNKKGKKKAAQEQQSSKSDESPCDDFPLLGMPQKNIEEDREADKSTVMKISMHEPIDDDDIQIVPHEDSVEIKEEPLKIKNEDFYDIDDDLPPLEPFSFENEDEKCEDDEKCDDEEFLQKQEMKSKMSKLLKDTNMVFAMCSSLKELGEGEASLSSSSHIQRSTSSSMNTNTTTSAFASATSNAVGEGHDSDYKSLDLDLEENVAASQETNENVSEFKVPSLPKSASVEDPEDVSSFEATSSETDADDSSKKIENFKREDDEELRPLLETSITSLSSPVDATINLTTEANATSTLPETNQKLQTTTTNTSNNGKRKNKKKRR